MPATVDHRRTPFKGERIDQFSPKDFDAVIEALSARMGVATIPDLHEIANRVGSPEAFAEEVTRRFVGSSGFMRFGIIDHGGWLSAYGIRRRSVRWIFGNPLIAITMIRHDITAGLFAPVEVLISEAEDGPGVVVTHVLPSSLMVVAENPQLLQAAQALDSKLEALLNDALAPAD